MHHACTRRRRPAATNRAETNNQGGCPRTSVSTKSVELVASESIKGLVRDP
eukprot:COSAG01_NODE_66_length_29241_cov_17.772768_23_plen_51_part_00